MSISLHGLLSSKIFRHIQIVLITLLQRKIPNFDAVLPIFCVGPNTIEYTFRKIGSTCLMILFYIQAYTSTDCSPRKKKKKTLKKK